MRTIVTLLLISYVVAWWTAFWILGRKRWWSPIAFIPAGIFAFSIPAAVSDIPSFPGTIVFLGCWAVLPFILVAIELTYLKTRKGS